MPKQEIQRGVGVPTEITRNQSKDYGELFAFDVIIEMGESSYRGVYKTTQKYINNPKFKVNEKAPFILYETTSDKPGKEDWRGDNIIAYDHEHPEFKKYKGNSDKGEFYRKQARSITVSTASGHTLRIIKLCAESIKRNNEEHPDKVVNIDITLANLTHSKILSWLSEDGKLDENATKDNLSPLTRAIEWYELGLHLEEGSNELVTYKDIMNKADEFKKKINWS